MLSKLKSEKDMPMNELSLPFTFICGHMLQHQHWLLDRQRAACLGQIWPSNTFCHLACHIVSIALHLMQSEPSIK